jgi:hypothetical protein
VNVLCSISVELEIKGKKAKKNPSEIKQEIAKKRMEFEVGQKKATEEFLKKQGKKSLHNLIHFFIELLTFFKFQLFFSFSQVTKGRRRASTKAPCFTKGAITSRNFTRTRTTYQRTRRDLQKNARISQRKISRSCQRTIH